MKVNTFTKHYFTADYYDYRVATGEGAGNTLEYFYVGTISCGVTIDGTGRLFLTTPETLRLQAKIHNVKDRNGVSVAKQSETADYQWTVQSVEPVLNPFGFADTLRYVLTRD